MIGFVGGGSDDRGRLGGGILSVERRLLMGVAEKLNVWMDAWLWVDENKLARRVESRMFGDAHYYFAVLLLYSYVRLCIARCEFVRYTAIRDTSTPGPPCSYHCPSTNISNPNQSNGSPPHSAPRQTYIQTYSSVRAYSLRAYSLRACMPTQHLRPQSQNIAPSQTQLHLQIAAQQPAEAPTAMV